MLGVRNSFDGQEEVMKIINVNDDNAVEVCLCPFWTSEILRSTHQPEGNINNTRETCQSDTYLVNNVTDAKDVAHALHHSNVNSPLMNVNGIDNFFYTRFKMLNLTNVCNVDNNEWCYPCDNPIWYDLYTRPSYSKNVSLNLLRVQEEIQRLLSRSTMAQ